MIQACLNGARPAGTPRLPVTPAGLARDAIAVRAAGAECLHVHPRDADGAESLLGADIARSLAAIREAVPDMPVGISTGDWIAPRGQDRLLTMAAWPEESGALPDYVSVNLSEPDAPQVMALMQEIGVGIELGLASTADVQRLFSLPDPAQGVVRALIEIDATPGPERRAEAELMRRVLLRELPGLPILLHGFEATAWDFVGMARRLGCDTRIGMEDVLCLPDGSEGGNAAMVRAARHLMNGL